MTEQKNVYLYYGSDEYMVDGKAKKKIDEICPKEEQTLSLEVIDGDVGKIDEARDVLDRCIAAFRTLGLFGGKKVVWLRDAAFLTHKAIMKSDRIKGLLGSLAEDIKKGLAPDQFLIISGPGIDKRSALYKAVSARGEMEEYEMPERDYQARPIVLKRTVDWFRQEGYSIDPDACDAFVDKVGFNMRMIASEVEKLILYKGDDKHVRLEDVKAVTSSAADAVYWDFTDAVAKRDLSGAILLFRQLLFQKENPIRLVISLENLFQNLLEFREYMDAGWLRLEGDRVSWSSAPESDEYFSEMANDPRKMHWYRASKLASQAQAYSAQSLSARKRLTVETHERMLSGGAISHELMVESLLARLCAPK